MSFGEKILKYKEDIIADLTELIAIQSISGFQDDTSAALEWMMKKAESFGLEYKSYDNIAGHVQLGNGGKLQSLVVVQKITGGGFFRAGQLRINLPDLLDHISHLEYPLKSFGEIISKTSVDVKPKTTPSRRQRNEQYHACGNSEGCQPI